MTRRRKVASGCAVVLLVALAIFLFSARRFLFAKQLDVVAISRASEYQDDARLKKSFALPVGSAYEHAGILYQPNGSLCGPTSVANVLRSLDRPDTTPDAVLAGSGKCPLGVCWGGLSLDELAELARQKTQRKVTVLRDLDLAGLRAHLARANDPARRYIANFDRGPLFGKVGGHHSPIGGYLEDEDLALVLDVNAKYKPWLVKAERLHVAIDTVDPSTE
jgi:hypothetical protein